MAKFSCVIISSQMDMYSANNEAFYLCNSFKEKNDFFFILDNGYKRVANV